METFPQMKALIDGTLDIGFTRAPQRYPSGLTGFIVDRQPLWLAIPEGHRLASRNMVEPEQYASEPFVATLLDMEIGFWGNIAAITPSGATLRVVARVPDAFSVLTSVAAGVGLGVMSEGLTSIKMPGIVYRQIMKTNRSSDHVLVYRKNEGATAIKAFIAMVRSRSRSA
jgi:DNA-binding transcriptional LysR family regulator